MNPMFADLKGKRVLITGASGGLGGAMAQLFAKHGARLGLHYCQNRNAAEQLLAEVSTKTDAFLFEADLLHVESTKRLMHEFVTRLGGIDVLINNAGAVYDYKHFSELSEKAFTDTFALNVMAPFYLTAEAFPHMKAQGGGRVVNISSINVKYGGSAKSLHYSAAKAALESLTRGFAKEGAAHTILVNAIRCGFIDTPMRARVNGYSEEHAKERVNLIPLKRMGKAEDIACMALYLASGAGSFITGEVVTVAGGD